MAISSGPAINTLFHALMSPAVIVVTARGMGVLFGLIGQPPVVGEVVAAASCSARRCSAVAPGAYAQLLPPAVTPFLSVYAQLGVILYMFLVGLELDLTRHSQGGPRNARHLAREHHRAVSARVVARPADLPASCRRAMSPFTVFALFLGVSLSVTAFPGARAHPDRSGRSQDPMGTLALTCAGVDDVTAWCLLAFVVSIAQARAADAVRTVAPDHRVRVRRAASRWRRSFAADAAARTRRELTRTAAEHRVRRDARIGDDHRVHRHPRLLRRVSARRDHPARQPQSHGD